MRLVTLSAIFVLALTAPVEAQKGKDKDHGAQSAGKQSEFATIVFGAAAERDIRGYFQTHPQTPQSLPPGIAKNLARGKALPPGIAKRRLPADLYGRLPSYPDHEIVIVDRDVYLVNVATQIIVDILTRVF